MNSRASPKASKQPCNILGGGRWWRGGIGRAVHQHSDPFTINHIPLGDRTGKRRRAGGDDEEEEEEG